MLELFKFILDRINVLDVAEAVRQRNNRRIAAQLHLLLLTAEEILELYELLLDEHRAALESHKKTNTGSRFSINPSRLEGFLRRQADNLEIFQKLAADLLDELKIIDGRFEKAYREIAPGKAGILLDAILLLNQGRFPLGESDMNAFPQSQDGVYRTLWFTSEPIADDRKEIDRYLHGDDGRPKEVVDVNYYDGERFFIELEAYLARENPYGRLERLKRVTEEYRQRLMSVFSIQDILTDIRTIRRFYHWAPERPDVSMESDGY